MSLPWRTYGASMAHPWRKPVEHSRVSGEKTDFIRRPSQHAARMNHGRNITRAILKTIARGEDRSPLFWWMVENHDRIAASSRGRISWKGVCSEAAARGLTDANGNPPSMRTARETWRKARSLVAAEREREATTPRRVGATPPSRLPKDWKPEAFRLQASTQAPPAARSSPPAFGPGLPVAGPMETSGAGADPMSKEARAALVPAGMPAWTAPQGDFVKPDQSPQVQAKLLRLEAQFRQADRYFGPPMKRREE